MPVSTPFAIASHPGERHYVSKLGGFSVAMPSHPEVSTRSMGLGDGTLEWTLMTTRVDESTFAVAYADIPLALLTLGQDAVVDRLKTQPLLEGVDWQAISNRGELVHLDGIPGREYLHLSEGRFSDVRFYLVNRRLYAVSTSSPELGEVYQFADSFQIADPWRSFVSEVGNFSVDIPAPPIVTPHQIEYQGTSF
jgi:hypothetical protein